MWRILIYGKITEYINQLGDLMENQYLLGLNDKPLFRQNPKLHNHLKENWWALVVTVKTLANRLNHPLHATGEENDFRLTTMSKWGHRLIVDVDGATFTPSTSSIHVRVPLQNHTCGWSRKTTSPSLACTGELRELILASGIDHLDSSEEARWQAQQLIYMLYFPKKVHESFS